MFLLLTMKVVVSFPKLNWLSYRQLPLLVQLQRTNVRTTEAAVLELLAITETLTGDELVGSHTSIPFSAWQKGHIISEASKGELLVMKNNLGTGKQCIHLLYWYQRSLSAGKRPLCHCCYLWLYRTLSQIQRVWSGGWLVRSHSVENCL